MINSVGRFMEDAGNLMRHEAHFYKAHWKGIVVLNVAVVGAMAGAYVYQQKRDEKWRKKQYREIKREAKKKEKEYEQQVNDIKVTYETE